MVPTRKDYMEKRVSHREYYASIARASGIHFPESPFIARVRAALASGDKHLNTIPLAEWDMMAAHRTNWAYGIHGDARSKAGDVCTLKEAARQAAERSEAKTGAL